MAKRKKGRAAAGRFLDFGAIKRKMQAAAIVAVKNQMLRLPEDCHKRFSWLREWSMVGHYGALGAFVALQSAGLISSQLNFRWGEQAASKAATKAILHPFVVQFVETYSGGRVLLSSGEGGDIRVTTKEKRDGEPGEDRAATGTEPGRPVALEVRPARVEPERDAPLLLPGESLGERG